MGEKGTPGRQNLITNEDITTEPSDKRRTRRPEAAKARPNACTKAPGKARLSKQ
jgi:hypothetical protein